MLDGKQWRLSAGVDLVWREWSGESVAYERFSGDLHCFDEVTAAILKLLTQHPYDEVALVTEIATVSALAPDHQLASFVQQSLQQLAGLGLVEETVAASL